MLTYQRAGFDIAFGILILIFSVTVLTGALILHDLGRRTHDRLLRGRRPGHREGDGQRDDSPAPHRVK